MHRFELQAALGHHPRGDRTVDAAGNEHRGFARAAGRQTARALLLVAVDERGFVAHFDVDRQVGVMYVHLQMRETRQQHAAHFHADFRRSERKLLVRTLGADFEGFCVLQFVGKVIARHAADDVHIFFDHQRFGIADEAEHLCAHVGRRVHVRPVRFGDRRHRGLRRGDLPRTKRRKTASQILDELILKRAPVKTLERDLAVFE